MKLNAIIVGAGPFGLSGASYLKAKGLDVAIFGTPMSFWQNHMPAGMYLRSNWAASHISDPRQQLTLDHFKADTGAKFEQPIPLEHFVAYGKWYQQKAVPDLHTQQVTRIEKSGEGFRVETEDGGVLSSDRVIVATGIAHFPWMPKELQNQPESHVSHSSYHKDLGRFAGQRMLVIGSGQSALDAGRLLYRLGAKVEIVARHDRVYWVGENAWLHKMGLISRCLYSNFDVGPAGISRLVGLPNIFRKLPRSLQDPISARAVRPAGTGWQRPQLANVPITVGCRVTSVEIQNDEIRVSLSNGTRRVVNHVIAATGYRTDVSRYDFLDSGITSAIQTVKGYPVLGRALESSVPGLHFVGKPAAWSFGPLLNFVSGTHFAAAELTRAFG